MIVILESGGAMIASSRVSISSPANCTSVSPRVRSAERWQPTRHSFSSTLQRKTDDSNVRCQAFPFVPLAALAYGAGAFK